MAVQNVANNPLGNYPVLVDKNTANSEMQVVRIDVGTGTAESRVTSANGLPVSIVGGGASDGAIVDGVSSSIKATVLDYASSNPLAVRLTDTAGDYVAAGAGTQYTEDAAAAANPVGGAIIVIRDDARGGSLTTTDGDNVAVRGTNAGEIYVKHVDTIAATQSGTWNITNVSGTVSLPTGASTSANQTTIIGHVDGIETLLGTIDADTSNISTKIDTLAGAVSGTEMQVDIVGALPAGTNAIGKLAANSGVDIGDVDVTSIIPGTGATNLGKAIDTATGATDTGVLLLATRDDALSALTPAEGDNVQLRTDANGALWVIPSGTITVASHAVTNAGTFAVQDATAQASLSVLDDWDESDRCKVNLIVGQAGIAAGVGATGVTVPRVVIANDQGKTLLSAGGSASSSGNNTLVAAGTNKLKVYAFSLTTTSTTAMTCIFQSGAGGTELWRCVLQAPTSVSTGANLAISPPAYLFATASATLLNLNLSSANAVHWSVSYFDET